MIEPRDMLRSHADKNVDERTLDILTAAVRMAKLEGSFMHILRDGELDETTLMLFVALACSQREIRGVSEITTMLSNISIGWQLHKILGERPDGN